ncbi:hypothetical protein [Microbulbifer aestuariivivens]|uniref:hypothetical protein n=1 Tax=Microbulbifer aestuariivivens TaxID=1908308 RepID=UPI0031E6AEF2
MPIWMLLRFFLPARFAGEQWEPKGFAVQLIGLAITLLTASEQSLPLQLSLYNLFVVLVYFFHWSALNHPVMQSIDQKIPSLTLADGSCWPSAGLLSDHCENDSEGESPLEANGGYLVVFLRGTFCADSRAQLYQLAQGQYRLEKNNVKLVLVSTEPAERWPQLWPGESAPAVLQLSSSAPANRAFIAPASVPIWFRLLGPWVRRWAGSGQVRCADSVTAAASGGAACRPSAWLLDDAGYIVWRYLPGNYRMPGSGEFLCGQVSRLED